MRDRGETPIIYAYFYDHLTATAANVTGVYPTAIGSLFLNNAAKTLTGLANHSKASGEQATAPMASVSANGQHLARRGASTSLESSGVTVSGVAYAALF